MLKQTSEKKTSTEIPSITKIFTCNISAECGPEIIASEENLATFGSDFHFEIHFNKFGPSPVTLLESNHRGWSEALGQSRFHGRVWSSNFFPFPASVPGRVSLTALMPHGLSCLHPGPRELGKDPQGLEHRDI